MSEVLGVLDKRGGRLVMELKPERKWYDWLRDRGA